MASKLGSSPKADGELPLVDGGDYEYSFQWQDPPGTPTNFPAGSALYYLIGAVTDPEPVQWDFVVTGNLATIHVDHEGAEGSDSIPNNVPFRLVYLKDENPKVLLYGKTKRYFPS